MSVILPTHHKPLRMDAPLTEGGGSLDHASRNLQAIFNGSLLVAVPAGVRADDVPPPLVTEVNSPGYNSRLATSNVAVTLGQRSHGLLAIQFTNRAELAAFLKRNPISRETLITEHPDGPVIWHTTEVAYRLSVELPGFCVKMNGNVQVFDRGDVRRADAFLNRATPTPIDLEALNWGADPDGHISVWLTQLQHGDFFRKVARGRLVPHREAWRGYVVRRLNAATAYDRPGGQFHRLHEGRGWQPITEAQLRDELRRLITVAPIPTAPLKDWCSDEWLDRLIRHLRISLAGELLLVAARLREFARASLFLSPRADVTVPELGEAFAQYCEKRGLPGLPAKVFQTRITAVLREPPWLRAKSKSVRRATGAQNGFRGLSLRTSPEGFGARIDTLDEDGGGWGDVSVKKMITRHRSGWKVRGPVG